LVLRDEHRPGTHTQREVGQVSDEDVLVWLGEDGEREGRR
jgi:hypothetical protein